MRKHIVCLGAVLMLGAFVPMASAYIVPGRKAGTAGGPCVKPKGGTAQSRLYDVKLCNRAAGFTGAELATKGSVSVTLHFKHPTTLRCNVTGSPVNQPTIHQQVGKGRLRWKKNHKGAKNLKVIFGTGGVAFLNAYNTRGEVLTVTCSVIGKHPVKKHGKQKLKKKGSIKTSTTHMVTMF